MAFSCIVTTVGQAKIAAAISSGVDLPLTEMAVGDGSGNPTTPSAAQTALVRETYRANLGGVSVDPAYPNRVIAEMTVPSAEGGWVLREVGIFDDVGALIAIANYPDTYKPLPSEGASRDLTIRVLMQVSDTSAVTLGIDASQVFATQAWVETNYDIAAQLPGGTTGQVARKASNADGDIEWGAPDAPSSFIVDVIRETQVLAYGQTIINLATLTTAGIALYIEGVRDEGFTINSTTQIQLDRSYPIGTRFYAYQNTPFNSSNIARKDLDNTFAAKNIFTGTDVGTVTAGQVAIGGGVLRTRGHAWIAQDGTSHLGVVGADPGSVASLQVAVGGGVIRAASATYCPAYVCRYGSGGIGVIRFAENETSKWSIFSRGDVSDVFQIVNKDYAAAISIEQTGQTTTFYGNQPTASPGTAQVIIGGGRVVAGQSMHIDTGVGTIGVLGFKSGGTTKWDIRNRDDAGGSLQVLQGGSTAVATFQVNDATIFYGNVSGTSSNVGEVKIGGGKIDARSNETMVLRVGSNNASGPYMYFDTQGSGVGYIGSSRTLLGPGYSATDFSVSSFVDLYFATNSGTTTQKMLQMTASGQNIFYGNTPNTPNAGEVRIGGGVICADRIAVGTWNAIGTTSVTLTMADNFVKITAGTGTSTITMPSCGSAGTNRAFTVMIKNLTQYARILYPNGSDQFIARDQNGYSGSISIPAYSQYMLVSDGSSKWFVF